MSSRVRMAGRYDYICPWCGAGIDDDCWYEGGDEYMQECPCCGREFDVRIEMEPRFTVRVPDEMRACKGCAFWIGYEGYCDFIARNNPVVHRVMAERLGVDKKPLSECPLGYVGTDETPVQRASGETGRKTLSDLHGLWKDAAASALEK